jgi:hypothetical protein
MALIDRRAKSKMKKFEYEFEDESFRKTISFEYDDEIDEEMEVSVENGVPCLYVNRQALLALAKTFIKMALCDYQDGFHVHLSQDFDGDKPEAIRCFLKS